MTHCDTCGCPLAKDSDGTWFHEPHPAQLDPRFCVFGMTNGVPYTLKGAVDAEEEDGISAVPCTDPGCKGSPEPWRDLRNED